MAKVRMTDCKGYEWSVFVPAELVSELTEIEKRNDCFVNWYLFQNNQIYWSDNGDRYKVTYTRFPRIVLKAA